MYENPTNKQGHHCFKRFEYFLIRTENNLSVSVNKIQFLKIIGSSLIFNSDIIVPTNEGIYKIDCSADAPNVTKINNFVATKIANIDGSLIVVLQNEIVFENAKYFISNKNISDASFLKLSRMIKLS